MVCMMGNEMAPDWALHLAVLKDFERDVMLVAERVGETAECLAVVKVDAMVGD